MFLGIKVSHALIYFFYFPTTAQNPLIMRKGSEYTCSLMTFLPTQCLEMKTTPIDEDSEEDQYENLNWPDISMADFDYEWEDSSTLDGISTSGPANSTASEFDFLTTDELDGACADVVDDSAFEAAEEECLRGSPVPSPSYETRRRGRSAFVAWVVFRGHEQGVFQSWYVIHHKFVLSYETVQAWSKRSAHWFLWKLRERLLLTPGSTGCLGACLCKPWCGSFQTEPSLPEPFSLIYGFFSFSDPFTFLVITLIHQYQVVQYQVFCQPFTSISKKHDSLQRTIHPPQTPSNILTGTALPL
jgi:hypothetical protein